MKNIFLRTMVCLYAAGALSACATTRDFVPTFDDPAASVAQGAPALYRQGLDLLDKDNHAEALAAFERLLVERPVSAYTQVAIFNSGRALEGLERWHEAQERYRAVIRDTERVPKLRVLALYRLSFCHEALGEDARTVASLVDVLNRSRYLPKEIGFAEMPARLAAAYARVGNVDEAMRYYARAEQGIARLRSQAPKTPPPEWLARTLYFMGRMSLRKISWDEFEVSLRPVEKAQFYLLQAAELDSGQWSEKAIREIKRVYDEIWAVLGTLPPVSENVGAEEALLERRQKQERQWEIAELVLQSLHSLRVSKPPEESGPSVGLEEVFAYTAAIEQKVFGLIERPLEGTGLTKEARERRERIRGRVVDPSDTLEMKFLKNRRESSPAAPEKKSSSPIPVPALIPDVNIDRNGDS